MADDLIARAEAALSPDARMDAYYYSFRNTGLAVIDSILSAVATAGKAYHHTEEWGEAGTWDDKPTHESRIQSAADESATLVRELVAELKTTRAQLAAVRELHKPRWLNCINYCCSGEECRNRYRGCICDEEWPCSTARQVYSADELGAAEAVTDA